MEGKSARGNRERVHIRVLPCGGRFDQPRGTCPRLVDQSGECQREDSTCADVHVVVAAAFELSAAQFGPPLRLSGGTGMPRQASLPSRTAASSDCRSGQFDRCRRTGSRHRACRPSSTATRSHTNSGPGVPDCERRARLAPLPRRPAHSSRHQSRANPTYVAMVTAASRSPWSAAQRNAVRRLGSSVPNQS